ncbi:hypothetical protein LTR91_024500 [Friedmanniomyces endolithicus]|uniref:SGNH hydrolase-type esterase domain-containing protein n=1 Tax=Friedmanniomyces endolithicus TaxID=329885 RepID=A0AAN6H0Z4_9PEZI|nr:hypothetical protein LTR35_018176 [Friedmanniomyces endolithicus]KAK0263635.1 hypothetical protein LTS00_018069 [Friedmanniomyces endolithicus]KAK0950580.1 hypothetical protein LTS01_025551 [Friedmanniomyces endolithicus]KAK0952267.1 hypothetical protein LTR91_024500 [Friedmanniomyces endolithicus]KAK0967495.1 hypothetical protein LTR54_018270 [Friedmanniomyces endolithicus]
MCFLVVAFVFLFFPAAPHPDAAGMNWGILIYGFVVIFALSYYYIRGRHQYDGPVSNNNDVSDLKYGRQKRVGCTLGQTLRRTAANTALYAQAIRDLGEELQIPVLDIHRSMLAHAGHDHLTSPFPGSMDRPTNPTLQSFLTDGLHLSGEGYRLMYGELMTLIEQNWPGGMPDRLPLMLPAWNFQPTWKVDGGIQEPEWEDGGWSGPLRERGGNPPVGSEREMLVTGQFTEVLKWVKK